MMEKITFLEFCNQLSGYNFFNEQGFQVYKYQLYWWNVSPVNVFKKYKWVLIPKEDKQSALD